MLKDYIKQIRGVSYKPTDILDKNSNNAVPIVRANNIQERGLNFDDLVYIDKSKVKDEQYLQAGDIVICASSGSKDLVGKAAYCLESKKASFGAFCKVVRTSALHKKYLSHFFQSDRYRREISESSKGANINNIRNEDIDNLQIIVPSIEEQQRIADELDKVSGLIEKRQKQLEKLDLLIKSRFVEMFGDPINNTKKLCLVKLNELGEWSSGGTPSRNIAKYFLGDIDWYSAGELKELFLTGSVEKITYEAIDNSSAKLFPQGSMLIGMYDTAAFKMGILKKASASNQACACIIPNNKISIIWLYYVLQEMKAYFLLNRRGIRQKNLNLGMIKNFVIPLAGKELQNQFADFVEKVEQNKSKVKNSLDKLITLKKALMQKYFG